MSHSPEIVSESSPETVADRPSTRPRTRLADAWRTWLDRPSPKIILAGIVLLGVVRLFVGGWSWADPACALGILLVYPFAEWAIHVYLLHLPPMRIRGRDRELPTAASHRYHHEHPHDLGAVLLARHEAVLLGVLIVPLVVLATTGLAGLLVDVPWEARLSMMWTGWALIGIYEWTHFLIHTPYRPKRAFYKRIHRNHRLHHFKNEKYWQGITSNIADTVLGTNPAQKDVERSPTARTLRPAAEDVDVSRRR